MGYYIDPAPFPPPHHHLPLQSHPRPRGYRCSILPGIERTAQNPRVALAACVKEERPVFFCSDWLRLYPCPPRLPVLRGSQASPIIFATFSAPLSGTSSFPSRFSFRVFSVHVASFTPSSFPFVRLFHFALFHPFQSGLLHHGHCVDTLSLPRSTFLSIAFLSPFFLPFPLLIHCNPNHTSSIHNPTPRLWSAMRQRAASLTREPYPSFLCFSTFFASYKTLTSPPFSTALDLDLICHSLTKGAASRRPES